MMPISNPRMPNTGAAGAARSMEAADASNAAAHAPVPAHNPQPENPPRPQSPSQAYHPGPAADAGEYRLHDALSRFRVIRGYDHPIAPTRPVGKIDLTPEQAAALEGFKRDLAHVPALDRQYGQTYRRDGGWMIPAHPELIPGTDQAIRFPPGSYPPGTEVVIHSRPFGFDEAANRPTSNENKRAYVDRTNALQYPGTHVDAHLLYNPATDQTYIFDGRMDLDGQPCYFEANHPPLQNLPVHPMEHWEAPAPAAPAPATAAVPQRPESPQALQSPTQWNEFINWDAHDSGSPAPKAASRPPTPQSPESPTPWNEFINFDPPTPT